MVCRKCEFQVLALKRNGHPPCYRKVLKAFVQDMCKCPFSMSIIGVITDPFFSSSPISFLKNLSLIKPIMFSAWFLVEMRRQSFMFLSSKHIMYHALDLIFPSFLADCLCFTEFWLTHSPFHGETHFDYLNDIRCQSDGELGAGGNKLSSVLLSFWCGFCFCESNDPSLTSISW